MHKDAGKFRAALVGAGYISEFHVAALRRANVEIVGVHDLDAARAQALADRFGLKTYSSMEALREAGANVLHVLTPPRSHAPVTLKALDLGMHVLVEKPLAEDAGDCERIERKAAEKGLKVCVNHSLLFDPQVKRLIDAVRGGAVGKVVSVDILRSSVYPPFDAGPLPPQYREAGYPFRDLGVHALYLFEALLGPIENVRADWKSLGGDPNLAFDEWRAQVRCREGMGQFQLSWNVKPLQSQIIVQGTKGFVRSDLFLMFQAKRASTPLPKAAERVINAMTDSIKPLIDVPIGVLKFVTKKVLPYHGLQDLVSEFYRRLERGEEAPVTVGDATRVVRWVEEVARAADEEHRRAVSVFTVSDDTDVLVTGASGGLGGAIADRFRAEGKRVRIFVRRPPKKVPEGVEVVLGDLGDAQAVDRAVKGAKLVVHAGAAMGGSWQDHQRATVTGTQNVLDACLKYNVEKLVHISSMSVIDWARGAKGTVISESTPYEPNAIARGHYTRAKMEAEKRVVQYAKEKNLPTVILRPGQIFGGKIPLLTGAVARRAGKKWLTLGDGKMPLPLVYIDDVVDAVMSSANGNLRSGEIIQLVDESAILTQNQVLKLVFGERVKVSHFPRPLLFALGGFSEVALGLLKRPSPLSRYRLRSALSHRTFRNNNTHLIAWTPRVGVREGIRRVSGSIPGAVATPVAATPRDAREASSDAGARPPAAVAGAS